MSVIFDTTNRADIWPNVETVTYFRKPATGGTITSGIPIYQTRRKRIKKDFLPQDSALLKMDIQWCFETSLLVASGVPFVPKIDEIFQDGAGVRWVIKIVEDCQTAWLVSCLRLQGVA